MKIVSLAITALLLLGCQAQQQESLSENARDAMTHGIASAARGDFREALSAYDRVLSLQSDNAQALYLRGVAHERLGDRGKALNDYTNAIALNSKLLPAFVARAAIHAAQGDIVAAQADYEAARRLGGDDQLH